MASLITSQNATAPKRLRAAQDALRGLITSQNATAPKRVLEAGRDGSSLITSQNATAPKPRPVIAPGLLV